jgi:hypothetical protein
MVLMVVARRLVLVGGFILILRVGRGTITKGCSTRLTDWMDVNGSRPAASGPLALNPTVCRAAIILASSQADASAAIFALRSLAVGTIYTVGFKSKGCTSSDFSGGNAETITKGCSTRLTDWMDVNGSSGRCSPPCTRGRVYLDLTSGPRKGDPLAVATRAGSTSTRRRATTINTIVSQQRLHEQRFLRRQCRDNNNALYSWEGLS